MWVISFINTLCRRYNYPILSDAICGLANKRQQTLKTASKNPGDSSEEATVVSKSNSVQLLLSLLPLLILIPLQNRPLSPWRAL